jgi:hypothetical protein
MYMKLGSACPLNPLTAASTAVRVSEAPGKSARNANSYSSSVTRTNFQLGNPCSLLRYRRAIQPTTASSSSNGTHMWPVLPIPRPN